MRKTTSGMTLLLGCLYSLHCVQIAGAIEVGPITPVEDRIFIIDGSGSISPFDFSIELDIIREFTCGPNAPDPNTTPFGVQVIFFSDTAFDLISYRVISTTIEAQDFCNQLMPVVPGGGTNLTSALNAAIISFQTTTLAGSRHLFVLTDGGIGNQQIVLNSAMTLRTLVPPVQICVTDVSADCFNSDILQEIANTELSPMHVPTEPTGLYGCTLRSDFTTILCVDCACATDCNANSILDTTDIISGTSQDCNANNIPDECDIAADPALDCNLNGILDECDLTDGVTLDCNNNSIPDECEDCDNNGIADECDLNPIYSQGSGSLSPIGLGSDANFTFVAPPTRLSDVTFDFTASADLDTIFTSVEVFLNGVNIGEVFKTTGTNCADPPDEDQIILTQASFDAIVGSGDADVLIVAFDSDPFACSSANFVTVTMSFFTPLLIDIDTNNNGIIDSCDLARGDFNLDGVVNVTDLLRLLGAWGVCPGCPEDTNLDGVVNVTDLLTLLANWG